MRSKPAASRDDASRPHDLREAEVSLALLRRRAATFDSCEERSPSLHLAHHSRTTIQAQDAIKAYEKAGVLTTAIINHLMII